MVCANKTHITLLFLYSIIAILAMWGLVSQSDNLIRIPIAIWTSIGAVSACGAMLEILIILRTRSALRTMKEQIKRMSKNSQVGLVMLEDQWPVEGLAGILNEYLTMIHKKMERLAHQQKELDLLISAGAADQQNTEAIIRSISDAVVVVNAFAELALANGLAEKLFGFDVNRDKLNPISEVITDRRLIKYLLPERWKHHLEPLKIEYELIVDGSKRFFNVTFSPVYIQGDKLWAIVMTLDDITHDRELVEMKTEFVNLVSHELRTPLSSIKAYTEMLLEGDITTQAGREKFYKTIADEADRLDRFIENILNLSKIESGILSNNFSLLNLDDALARTIPLVEYIAKEKSVKLEYTPPAEQINIWADADLLKQAVLNLLSNAIKYTDSGGTVILTATLDRTDDTYRISVKDTGRGISPSELSRIFERFYRAKSAGAKVSGTGLGLALVKKVVEEVHQGRIECESTPGEGSTFTMIMPIKPAGAAEDDSVVQEQETVKI